jgi:hypothetical protein
MLAALDRLEKYQTGADMHSYAEHANASASCSVCIHNVQFQLPAESARSMSRCDMRSVLCIISTHEIAGEVFFGNLQNSRK